MSFGRLLEFAVYGFVLFLLVANYGGDGVRRPPAKRDSEDKNILIPDNKLPDTDAGEIVLELEETSSDAIGTGFRFVGDHRFITARHVVLGCSDVYAVDRTKGNKGMKGYPVRSIQIHPNADLAGFYLSKPTGNFFAPANEPARRGDEAYMMGYPQGRPADVRVTMVGERMMRTVHKFSSPSRSRGPRSASRSPATHYNRMADRQEQVTVWVERERRPSFNGWLGGISGGPVVNSNGRIVGVVVAGCPMRGRVYASSLENALSLAGSQSRFRRQFSKDNEVWTAVDDTTFDQTGGALRAGHTIVQLYCKS